MARDVEDYKKYDEDYRLISDVELIALLEDAAFLDSLISAGVDNWEGYSIAFNEAFPEEEIEEEIL
jgi:hypothetical protein